MVCTIIVINFLFFCKNHNYFELECLIIVQVCIYTHTHTSIAEITVHNYILHIQSLTEEYIRKEGLSYLPYVPNKQRRREK